MERSNWPTVALGAVTAVAVFAILGVTVAAGVVLSHYDDRVATVEQPEAGEEFNRGPVEAIVDLDESGKDRWLTTLGDKCDMDQMYVLAVGQDASGVDVITIPSDCETTRLRIAPEDGSVRPEDPLTLKMGALPVRPESNG